MTAAAPSPSGPRGRTALLRPILAALAALAAIVAAPAALAAAPGETELISQPDGNAGVPSGLTGASGMAAATGSLKNADNQNVSQTGQFVAFVSSADGMVPLEDDDTVANAYVRDTTTNTTILVSRETGPNGAPADADSQLPAISDDGTKVAFQTEAQLDPLNDLNSVDDIYVRDIVTDTTTLVSAIDGGAASVGNATDNASRVPSIDEDGSDVAFQTNEPVDAADDLNLSTDIYIRSGNSTELVSRLTGPTGKAGGGASTASIDDTGDNVLFQSSFNTFESTSVDGNATIDIYVRDRVAGTTVLASRIDGAGTNAGNSFSRFAAISGDGDRVAFESAATNLLGAGNDTNASLDIFVRDLPADATFRASLKDDDTEITGVNVGSQPSINDDGTKVAFMSQAQGLVAGDADGTQTAYVRDTTAGTTEFVSRDDGAAGAVGPGQDTAISGDATTVAFNTHDDDYSTDDDDGFQQVFLRRRATHSNPNSTEYVSRPTGNGAFHGTGDLGSDTGGSNRAASWDGRYVAFRSVNDSLVDTATFPQADTNASHVFRRDSSDGTTVQVDLGPETADNPDEPARSAGAGMPSITADGSRVAFSSQSFDLVPSGFPGSSNIQAYARDLDSGITQLLSRADGGAGAPSTTLCQQPAISGDGSHAAFICNDGADLDPAVGGGFAAGRKEIYLREIATGATSYVHQADDESAPSADPPLGSGNPVLSLDWDGSHLAFASAATNLTGDAGENGTDEDVFVRDFEAGTTTLASRADGVAGPVGDNDSASPSLDGDGNRVAFHSRSGNLGADADTDSDVFVRDLSAAETMYASDGTGAQNSDGGSYGPSLSEEGTRVSFASDATNLIAGNADTNAVTDIFHKNLKSLGTDALLVSRDDAADGDAIGDAESGSASVPGAGDNAISYDGNCVAFASKAANLDPGWASNDAAQVFRRVVTSECPDTTPPETSIDSGPSGTINDTTPSASFSASERHSTFTCAVDGGTAVPCESPFTTIALPDGPHTISVAATDLVGNTDPSAATRSFTVDTADGPPPGEGAFGARLLVKVKKRASVNRRGRLGFKVVNKNAFRVGVRLVARSKGQVRLAGSAAKTRKVRFGAKRAKIAPGATKRIRFAASKKGRRAMEAARRLKLRVVLTATDTVGERRKLRVTRKIKPPKGFRA